MDSFEIREHMEVRGSDGEHVGTVDRVDGDRIKLTKSDPSAGGKHSYLPISLVKSCENDIVQLSATADSARGQLSREQVAIQDGQI